MSQTELIDTFFNDGAKSILTSSEVLARERGDAFVAPEHALIKLTADDERAAAILASRSLTHATLNAAQLPKPDVARAELAQDERGLPKLPFTPTFRSVVERAFREAQQSNKPTVVRPAHLLLALTHVQRWPQGHAMRSLDDEELSSLRREAKEYVAALGEE